MPHSGTAFHIEEAIWNFLVENQVDVTKLRVVGTDGTNVNTGNKRGIIALLEGDLEKALQWAMSSSL